MIDGKNLEALKDSGLAPSVHQYYIQDDTWPAKW